MLEGFLFLFTTTLDERLHMAKWLIENKKVHMPVVLDEMDNKFLAAYNSWSIRLYIIDKEKIVYCGKQGPFGYAPNEVGVALDEIFKNFEGNS